MELGRSTILIDDMFCREEHLAPKSELTMNPLQQQLHRRTFLNQSATGLGVAALASLFNRDASAGRAQSLYAMAKAKRVIWLFQSRCAAGLDLFDYKPKLQEFHKQNFPTPSGWDGGQPV